MAGGYVYLLHFHQLIAPGRHTCQHYIGWTDDLAARIQKHYHGTGSRLCKVAKERGIGFDLVRVWRGDRRLERKLKEGKHGRRLCPFCSAVSQRSLFELTPEQIADELIAF